MSQPDDPSQEALKRLQERLEAFDGQRAPNASGEVSAERGIGEGYRLLGEVIGGVLGGIGLGWVFDHYAHTTPIGVVVGLLVGTAASAYVAMRSAERSARKAARTED